ncbi:hypothetical protein PR048_003825 [Dryococelus australis]|uniref:Uncharacterized protein n=1 Tax=Dryococelus australis TaxID=614101 RepID=A0ABQ9IQA7_9NEOP|nr:hypothetical protein PR048_003825 [Dryococelus australis]
MGTPLLWQLYERTSTHPRRSEVMEAKLHRNNQDTSHRCANIQLTTRQHGLADGVSYAVAVIANTLRQHEGKVVPTDRKLTFSSMGQFISIRPTWNFYEPAFLELLTSSEAIKLLSAGRPLASHQGEPGSIPCRISARGNRLPDDAVDERVFSGISRFPRPFIPRRCSILIITLIGSQDLAVKSCPYLFTLFQCSAVVIFPLLYSCGSVLSLYHNKESVSLTELQAFILDSTAIVLPVSRLTKSTNSKPRNTAQAAQGRVIGGRNGKESAMAFVGDSSQHSPGVVSGNHGKPKSGWSDRDSNPGPPCTTTALSLSRVARISTAFKAIYTRDLAHFSRLGFRDAEISVQRLFRSYSSGAAEREPCDIVIRKPDQGERRPLKPDMSRKGEEPSNLGSWMKVCSESHACALYTLFGVLRGLLKTTFEKHPCPYLHVSTSAMNAKRPAKLVIAERKYRLVLRFDSKRLKKPGIELTVVLSHIKRAGEVHGEADLCLRLSVDVGDAADTERGLTEVAHVAEATVEGSGQLGGQHVVEGKGMGPGPQLLPPACRHITQYLTLLQASHPRPAAAHEPFINYMPHCYRRPQVTCKPSVTYRIAYNPLHTCPLYLQPCGHTHHTSRKYLATSPARPTHTNIPPTLLQASHPRPAAAHEPFSNYMPHCYRRPQVTCKPSVTYRIAYNPLHTCPLYLQPCGHTHHTSRKYLATSPARPTHTNIPPTLLQASHPRPAAAHEPFSNYMPHCYRRPQVTCKPSVTYRIAYNPLHTCPLYLQPCGHTHHTSRLIKQDIPRHISPQQHVDDVEAISIRIPQAEGPVTISAVHMKPVALIAQFVTQPQSLVGHRRSNTSAAPETLPPSPSTTFRRQSAQSLARIEEGLSPALWLGEPGADGMVTTHTHGKWPATRRGGGGGAESRVLRAARVPRWSVPRRRPACELSNTRQPRVWVTARQPGAGPTPPPPDKVALKTPVYLQLCSAFEAERRGSVKGETDELIFLLDWPIRTRLLRYCTSVIHEEKRKTRNILDYAITKVSVEQLQNERAGRSPRKPVDQRHSLAQFPHAKIRREPAGIEPGSPCWECSFCRGQPVSSCYIAIVEALLKFYFEDTSPPHENKTETSLENYIKGTIRHIRAHSVKTELLILFPSLLHFGAAPYSSRFTLTGSQDPDVKSRPSI